MVAAANMVEIAALVGDTARATMLASLMGAQALTSSELAGLARVSRATASALRQRPALFDYFVGEREQVRRNCEAIGAG
jgi:hypothetical protein